MVHQADLARQPHRHERIHSGLEFNQEVGVRAALPAPRGALVPHAHQQIVVALLELGAHVPRGHEPHLLRVDVLGPGLVSEQLRDRLDHFGIREHLVVRGVAPYRVLTPPPGQATERCPLLGIDSRFRGHERNSMAQETSRRPCLGLVATRDRSVLRADCCGVGSRSESSSAWSPQALRLPVRWSRRMFVGRHCQLRAVRFPGRRCPPRLTVMRISPYWQKFSPWWG